MATSGSSNARCARWTGTRSSPARRCAKLLVPDVEDLVLADPTGGLHLDLVARVLADDRAGDRRADGDLAFLDVGLVVADDLVGHFLAILQLFEVDGRAEHAAPFRVEQFRIDDLRVRELRLDF